MAMQYRVKLPRHHPGQAKVVREAKRFNALACGVRWGKSTFGMDRLVHGALAGFPVAWYAPTNKSLAESWELAKRILKPVTVRPLEVQHSLELLTGGKVEMWSLEDPDASRGRKYKLAVIDEAAHARHLEYSWTRVIRQRLTDFRGGAWFLSTPRGFNFFKRLYDRGQDRLDPDWMSWQMPTSTNPCIAGAEIEDARADMSEMAFNQEYLAQFVSFEGAVFRFVMDAATMTPADGPKENREYVFGIDWGQKLDYTVVVVIDAIDRAVVAMERWGAMEYTVQRDRLKAMYERWRPSAVVAESNSIGQPIIEQLYRDGMPVHPFQTTNSSKAIAVEALALAFERGDIRIIPHPELLAEMQAFEAQRLPSGLMRYAAPQGQHDDCVMALAIGWSVIDSHAQQVEHVVYDEPMRISAF